MTHGKTTIIHFVTKSQLADIWFKNPSWENRAPGWWHLLFKWADK